MRKIRLNLRKVIATTAICLAASATMFAQETGVVINGVTWATRNIDAFGTFALTPESSGMFYQWNIKDAANFLLYADYFASDFSKATSWLPANDPSPAGWKVPTKTDFDKLLDVTKVDFLWTTVNSIYGVRFTDKTTGNSIFLPAAGYRDGNNGALLGVGIYGNYWSSKSKAAATLTA